MRLKIVARSLDLSNGFDTSLAQNLTFSSRGGLSRRHLLSFVFPKSTTFNPKVGQLELNAIQSHYLAAGVCEISVAEKLMGSLASWPWMSPDRTNLAERVAKVACVFRIL